MTFALWILASYVFFALWYQHRPRLATHCRIFISPVMPLPQGHDVGCIMALPGPKDRKPPGKTMTCQQGKPLVPNCPKDPPTVLKMARYILQVLSVHGRWHAGVRQPLSILTSNQDVLKQDSHWGILALLCPWTLVLPVCALGEAWRLVMD